MRELLFKNLISKDKRRSELFLCEHFAEGSALHEVEKKTVYRVKSILEFTSDADLQLFMDRKLKEESGVQRFIIKKHDKHSGAESVFYKVTGEQFVLLKDKVLVLKVSQYVKKTVIHKEKSKGFISGKLSITKEF